VGQDPAGNGRLGGFAVVIIRTGLEQWDIMQAARARVKRDGQMVEDRFGQSKVHPLLSVIRDNANGVRQTFKLLGLDFMEVDE